MLYDLLFGRTIFVDPEELPDTDWLAMLDYTPIRNKAAKEFDEGENRMVLQLPPDAGGARRTVKQKALAVARGKPVSLVLQGSGREVWSLCNGRRSIREIIARYNQDRKLSFHTARLSVLQFIKQLSQRGFIIIITD